METQDETTPFDRVILQDEAKLWRAECVLSYLDSDVYDFSTTLFEISMPLPVTDDVGKKIGFAYVSREEGPDRLTAKIAIDYATEERFLAELNITKLYPRVFGRMSLPAQPLFDFSAKLMVIRLKIDGLQLSTHQPADSRITHLPEVST